MTEPVKKRPRKETEPRAQDGQQHFRNLWEYPLCEVSAFEQFVGLTIDEIESVCGGFEIKRHDIGGKTFCRPVIIGHYLRALQ